jgi:hypothetical protein
MHHTAPISSAPTSVSTKDATNALIFCFLMRLWEPMGMLDFLMVIILVFLPSDVLGDALSNFLHVFIVPSLTELWEFVCNPLCFLQPVLQLAHCLTFKMLWIYW